MGRGRGGYAEPKQGYLDSGGFKVTDKGAIWIAERYIEMGYEVVFRRQHQNNSRQFDLTVKTSNDQNYVKNIEVKKITTLNPSNIAKNIYNASGQINAGDTTALYFETRTNTIENQIFIAKGIEEAQRKGFIKGPIEVWFSDKSSITY